jgi:cyclopropane-fatty-acyl-phospholipid synthase
MHTIHRAAETAVMSALARMSRGRLTIESADGRRHTVGTGLGGHDATLRVHDPAFFVRVLSGGEVAIGDAYMDGLWSSPDLVALVRVMLANRDALDGLPGWLSFLPRRIEAARHWWRDNSRAGSRRNIAEHYDLGNDFFQLFLDANLLYSCAIFEEPSDTLEAAQIHKLRAICDRLELRPTDRILEIGTGWGGFAMFAATRYGCHVTTATISARQHDFVRARLEGAGDLRHRIDLRLEDYRDLQGRFDKIVSIEMFEAVGLRHYDDFFAACDRLLAPDGAMLMQTITVDDWRFQDYLRTPSWIAKRIFPGSELASIAAIASSLGRVTRLGLRQAVEIGPDYAPTLREWRRRFLARLDSVRAQGFDDRFIRMWDLYLAFCEAAFAAGHVGNQQLLLARSAWRAGRGRSVTPDGASQPDALAVTAH